MRGAHRDDGSAQERFATVEELLAADALDGGARPGRGAHRSLSTLRHRAASRLKIRKPGLDRPTPSGVHEHLSDSAS